ncbi:MAG: efflux RND transporter permease subunit [Sulfurovum sp.]|nr:efflux RND transporter permease subunit [Sulfurovum sp.]
MFENILKFFITNTRINYLLFVMAFLTGIYSYFKIPKEIFPSFELDMISISGGYSGTSIDTLDKIAVKRIEDEIKNIDGIKEMSTSISPGSFNIILELEKRVDKYNVANKVKDAISLTKQYFPSDMNDPLVKVLSTGKFLSNIVISSSEVSHDKLIEEANRLKDKIFTLKNISGITLYGNADIYYDIALHSSKITALGLNSSDIINALRGLSYIYPIGKIEDSKEGYYYLSTFNGAKSEKEMMDTQIVLQGKHIYLKDIATIHKKYAKESTLFSVDTKDAVALSIHMSEVGNALNLDKKIKTIVKQFHQENIQIEYLFHNNQTIQIRNRLNTVISNILLGIIMITILVLLLINGRMSFIIFLGIPTSFVIGVFYLYVTDNTINMISLIGVLIALGIIVDDAIVVSENIQQYIEKGVPAKEAAYLGTKEMFKPVTIASLTTLFAFIPALLIGGVMGEVIKLIPITVAVLVLASLIESFIFLPIHAAHSLKKCKVTDWSKVNHLYSKILRFFMKYKKIFLTLFLIMVPVMIVFMLNMSKFNMFPSYDASTVSITLKANVNKGTQEIDAILKSISKELLVEKKAFNIAHITTIAGWRLDSGGHGGEHYPYVGQLEIEFEKLKAQNFIERYITPFLSLYPTDSNKTRETKSFLLSKELRKFMKEKAYKKRFNLLDIGIHENKVGGLQPDIEIGLSTNDMSEAIKAMYELKQTLLKIKGVTSADDSVKYGVDEIKLKVNSYGESLGVDEQLLGQLLSSFYLDKKISTFFDKNHLLEIRVHSDKRDSLNDFKNFELDLGENGLVSLKDVVDFKMVKSFEKIIKNFGEKRFYVYANLDTKMISSSEVIKQIQPLLDKIKDRGIVIHFEGEQKEQEALANDMLAASLLAMMLIVLSLLYLFNSFRETFMMLSVIPLSLFGVLLGHILLNINISLPSVIGILGLSGVVINDGIIMMMNLKKAHTIGEVYLLASKRFRPIIITTITTLVGLSSLIFFSSGQAVIFQPMAISLGFGLLFGTILNLVYLPVLFVVLNRNFLNKEEIKYAK